MKIILHLLPTYKDPTGLVICCKCGAIRSPDWIRSPDCQSLYEGWTASKSWWDNCDTHVGTYIQCNDPLAKIMQVHQE